MEIFIESLRTGNIAAWIGLLLVSIIVIKLLFKFSKLLVLIGILVALGFGVVALFPDKFILLTEWIESFSSDNFPEILPE